MELILGDSSDIYEFSSKMVGELDENWEGSWVISDTLGGDTIIEGLLVKNKDIFNDDSLIGEDFRKTYKIFEPAGNEVVEFNDDVIEGSDVTITGSMFTLSKDEFGNEIRIPVPNKYITITIKGVFVAYSRSLRVKTDEEGNFTCVLNIGKTIKTPENSFFIFQIMPLESEKLQVKSYYLTVEVRQRDENNVIIFRKEVLQAKLKILQYGLN